MADERGARPALTTDEVRAFIDRAPRCEVSVHVLYQPPGVDETVETQLVNLSRSGMFLASRGKLLDIGVVVDFKFSMGEPGEGEASEALVVMKGTAEVVRLALTGERGMGLRFVALDAASRELVDRIVDVNSLDPAPVPFEEEDTSHHTVLGGRAVEYGHGSVRIVLSPATAAYFTYNPLMHIGIGGCFIPAESDVPLGTGYQLDIVDANGSLLLRCKGKVAAKQERRIGIRLVDLDRPSLLRLRAEVTKVSAGIGPASSSAR
jgi:PilZ domain